MAMTQHLTRRRFLQTTALASAGAWFTRCQSAPRKLSANEKLNIGVIARVPLDEGSLGGKLTLHTQFPSDDWRSNYFGPDNLQPTIERVERLKKILPSGMILPEMAFRFILSNPDVSTTIPGMRKPRNVQRNLAASDGEPLPSRLVDALRAHRWDRNMEIP